MITSTEPQVAINGRYSIKDTCKALSISRETLRRYTNEKGKIVPRRVTGNCALHQRYIAKQVKRARAIALMPYTR